MRLLAKEITRAEKNYANTKAEIQLFSTQTNWHSTFHNNNFWVRERTRQAIHQNHWMQFCNFFVIQSD